MVDRWVGGVGQYVGRWVAYTLHAHAPCVACAMLIVQEIGPSTFHMYELPRAPTLGRCSRMKGTHAITLPYTKYHGYGCLCLYEF